MMRTAGTTAATPRASPGGYDMHVQPSIPALGTHCAAGGGGGQRLDQVTVASIA
jgi:hypothetical protein